MIIEDKVMDYRTTIADCNLRNKYKPEQIAAPGTKTRTDANNQEGKRPASITVNLQTKERSVNIRTAAGEGDHWIRCDMRMKQINIP